MANILGIGVAVWDIILDVDCYPREDSEVRTRHYQQRCGGNAVNTLNVLAQLNHQCSWSGTLANDTTAQLIKKNLQSFAINAQWAQTLPNTSTPTSHILRNTANGSRTIVHYRCLPELDADQFLEQVNLDNLDWLHCEARNCLQTLKILAAVKQKRPDLPISIEFEKKRDDKEQQLLEFGEPLLFSRHYVQERGRAQNPVQFLEKMSQRLPGRILICPWGKKGVYAIDQEGVLHHRIAHKVESVVDSIGAGDTFNAGVIHGFLQRQSLPEILNYACHLAAKKCKNEGLNGFITR